MNAVSTIPSSAFRGLAVAFLLGGFVPAGMASAGYRAALWIERATSSTGPTVVGMSTWPYLLGPILFFVVTSALVGVLLREKRLVGSALLGQVVVSTVWMMNLSEPGQALIIPGLMTLLGMPALVLGAWIGSRR